MRREIMAVALAAFCASASAQLFRNPDRDWQEAEAPPPPAVRTQGLLPIDMPRTALQFGVDPTSISVGPDGVVRYVVVATSTAGAVNAMYEGVRCDKAEVRTYARHNPDTGWVKVDAEWRSLHDGSPATRHALAIARQGACVGHAVNSSPSQIARDLRASPEDRFRNEIRR